MWGPLEAAWDDDASTVAVTRKLSNKAMFTIFPRIRSFIHGFCIAEQSREWMKGRVELKLWLYCWGFWGFRVLVKWSEEQWRDRTRWNVESNVSLFFAQRLERWSPLTHPDTPFFFFFNGVNYKLLFSSCNAFVSCFHFDF